MVIFVDEKWRCVCDMYDNTCMSPMCRRRRRRRRRTTGSNSQGFRWSCSHIRNIRVFHPPCCQPRSYITYYTYISMYNNTVLYYAVTSVRIHTLYTDTQVQFNPVGYCMAAVCSTQQYYT